MILKKYILGELLSKIENGAVIKQNKGATGIPITRIETLSNGFFNRDKFGYADIEDPTLYANYVLEDNDLLMSHINSKEFVGRTVIYKKQANECIIHGMNLLRIKTNAKLLDPEFTYYYFQTDTIKRCLYNLRKDAIGQSSIAISDIKNMIVSVPNISIQKEIAFVLRCYDRRIELNQAINQNLEAMAKQLYDYWFVQFDFPDENGKPYKSSGGKMVWNEKLKREIPIGWKDITFNSFINKNKAGDWGDDIPKDGTIKVGCVRGADIIKLNDVPTRYITSKHSNRLLEDGDIVIEVSGGSPIQATGRVALITNGVIERNGGALVCSNFCQSFSMKKRVFSEYFYYLWKNLYDNDNMFNFEGKTSGIKNFQTEIFLANHWFEVPKQLIETFHAVVSQYHLMIDQNIAESNNLIKLRDELLPLLMNGQVSVNSDLFDD